MSKTTIFAAIGVVALALAAFFTVPGATIDETVSLSANAQTEEAPESADSGSVQEMALGDADAPVTIVEYASFTCPHCATFHENSFKQLKTDYIDTGKVKFVMREVYFDRLGLWAGMVARCDGGTRYFGLLDMIFKSQRNWTNGDPAEVADNLKKMGRLAGIGNDALEACLQDNEMAKALTAEYQKNAQKDGIRSTPSFVINGKLHSNMSYGEMKVLIDAAL